MTAGELRKLTKDVLVLQLKDCKVELFNLRFQRSSGRLLNPARIRNVKKNVARILTILKEGTFVTSDVPAKHNSIKQEVVSGVESSDIQVQNEERGS
jgi:large subunit ribosomal protein L29